TYRARVTMDIGTQYEFSRDTSAEILTAGLPGEQYIGLTQGGDIDGVQAGHRFSRTAPALVLEQPIGKSVTSAAGTPADSKEHSGESPYEIPAKNPLHHFRYSLCFGPEP